MLSLVLEGVEIRFAVVLCCISYAMSAKVSLINSLIGDFLAHTIQLDLHHRDLVLDRR